MHPKFFDINTPDFLHFLLPEVITVYSYGFLIMVGAIMGMTYTAVQSKRQFGMSLDTANTMFLIIFIGAFVGGKFFYFLENPGYFSENPGKLFGSRGFVFYGSLIFAITGLLVFFRIQKLPTLKMLDIIAVTTGLVHVFGRMGCFMAGCCYGKPTESAFGVAFRNPESLARPLDTHLHPTQLYSALLITLILATVLILRKKQRFDGQLFLTYLIIYTIGRSVIEVFRGDISRGFIINETISHSQFISLVILSIAIYYYRKLNKDAPRQSPKKLPTD